MRADFASSLVAIPRNLSYSEAGKTQEWMFVADEAHGRAYRATLTYKFR